MQASVFRIDREIQFEHVDPRLAQKSPLPILKVIVDKLHDFTFRNLSFQ